MDQRRSLLRELLEFSRPLPEIAEGLAAHNWDVSDPLVALAEADVCRVLTRYLAGELSATHVELWANAVECRDDIEYNPDTTLGGALHELANPLLTCPLTRRSAATLAAALG